MKGVLDRRAIAVQLFYKDSQFSCTTVTQRQGPYLTGRYKHKTKEGLLFFSLQMKALQHSSRLQEKKLLEKDERATAADNNYNHMC